MKASDGARQSPGRVWCMWGSYEPATISAVQNGMYCCQFAGGGTRCVTITEIVLADEPVPVQTLQASSVVALRDEGADRWVRASFVRSIGGECE
eukprot:6924152-Prymnesium_polylepis.1